MKNKDEILKKLFASKWNYHWGRVDVHVITLFYRKGGFAGLYNYVVSEKERIDKDKYSKFSSYYSSDLIETLEKANKYLMDEDFREYILKSPSLCFNKNNFLKLEQYGLLEFYDEFGTSFKGDIVNCYTIRNYRIIEVLHEDYGKRFMNEPNFGEWFETLEQALINKIYKGRHFDMLLTLLNSLDNE